MRIEEVFEEVVSKIESSNVLWSEHSLTRLRQRFQNQCTITRDDIKKAVITTGELIRFEWQLGYDAKILVFAVVKKTVTTNNNNVIEIEIPFHISIENSRMVKFITLYDELYKFEADMKTRKREYFNRL